MEHALRVVGDESLIVNLVGRRIAYSTFGEVRSNLSIFVAYYKSVWCPASFNSYELVFFLSTFIVGPNNYRPWCLLHRADISF